MIQRATQDRARRCHASTAKHLIYCFSQEMLHRYRVGDPLLA
jgi:hypothetical protein